MGIGLASPMNPLTRLKSRSTSDIDDLHPDPDIHRVFRRTILITIVGPILLLLSAELALRYLGVADPLLDVPANKIGHLLAKNQAAQNIGTSVRPPSSHPT